MSHKMQVRFPSFKELLQQPVLMLGFGLGSGLIKPGPGTWGTLLGLLLMIPLILWNEWAAWGLVVLSVLFGNFICGRSADMMQVHDHGGIVWDEFAGIWLVMVFLPEQSLWYWVAAFIAFRVFDIFKPWPINWADQKVSGGAGIMLDDIIAACYAIIIIWAVQYGFFMVDGVYLPENIQ
ncbi:phosphatidylglycerophosphatase A family protein [Thiosulfativibrio zosterae]|uniref:Phosphatidylglycerophosphatase A n=1 Tax=Thiosulfativibrio zosterae TaxID=2675053 RepID=A0A6F8PPA9_9GAMM|nr:phosphatidylglycerophosphatase A [Thiosulfativibrio zosterae]BBP43830.1 phosphatidylglycerophosphatase A [Thiosulfativibrio zosterae]